LSNNFDAASFASARSTVPSLSGSSVFSRPWDHTGEVPIRIKPIEASTHFCRRLISPSSRYDVVQLCWNGNDLLQGQGDEMGTDEKSGCLTPCVLSTGLRTLQSGQNATRKSSCSRAAMLQPIEIPHRIG